MEARAQTLLDHSKDLFGKRGSLLSLWQELALNFYPERADFTTIRNVGSEYADHLMTSYPLLARRELGETFSAMLRPSDREWAFPHTIMEDQETEAERAWLEWAGGTLRRAMYDPDTMFVRATKEGDDDFATFGNAVISVELNPRRNALLYRCWHLRDTAWCESADGQIDTVYRKWKPTAVQLVQLFGKDKVSADVLKLSKDKPYDAVNCLHAVVPAEGYDAPKKSKRQPYVSIYLEVDTGNILSEQPSWDLGYVIPRWRTTSGSQYGRSAATEAALPDSRLLQAMTLTILDAGEMAAAPPFVAYKEALRSDLAIYSRGITYVDSEVDETKGEPLRALPIDSRGLPFAVENMKDFRELIKEAFYGNKLNMPGVGENPDMTAFEVGQRIQQYIRQSLPVFAPAEQDYNAPLCLMSWNRLMRNGAFGPLQAMPPKLQAQGIRFRFTSPLSEAIEAIKVQKFSEAIQIVNTGAAIDPSVGAILDAPAGARDAMRGGSIPAKWIRSEDDAAALVQQQAKKQQTGELLDGIGKASAAAKNFGAAAQAASAANLAPGGQPGASV